jgi:uncharacterized protein
MTLNQQNNRIEAIDVLRGFTLFGIALIHMVEQYYAGQPPEDVGVQPTIADGIAQGFIGIFIMGKFFMIFSFLFGLSFYLQFSKSDSEGNFLVRFAWRLLILFAIGMIHHMHYRGDILGIYAILGFTLLLFYRLPDRYLLILALILVFNVPNAVMRTIQIFYPGENPFNQDPKELLAYYTAVKSGTYFDIIKANLAAFKFKMVFQVWSGRIYITEGLFLLGIYAGRKKFFENASANLPFVKRLLRTSLWTILGCIVFGASIAGLVFGLGLPIKQEVLWIFGGFASDAANTALATVYVTSIVLLFRKEKWYSRLMVLYPVGRMGLTIYLLQTAIGTFIFFSYGLDLLYDIGAAYCFLMAIAAFILQIIFARLWFRYFAYGPVEWLWRTLTYFKAQKLTLARVPVVAKEVL